MKFSMIKFMQKEKVLIIHVCHCNHNIQSQIYTGLDSRIRDLEHLISAQIQDCVDGRMYLEKLSATYIVLQ